MTNNQSSVNITRRNALKKMGMGVVASAVIPKIGINAFSVKKAEALPPRMPDSEWSKIRGFNYQPSYGSTGFELWQQFDAKIIASELEQGKRFFPKMNALRWWQSWDSFLRDPKRYAHDFDKTLEMAEKAGCKVIPCLFNRWHDWKLDYGGIYIDYILPKANWVQKSKMYSAFLKATAGQHKDDPRIFAWDLCNEPFSYSCGQESIPDIVKEETYWLKSLYDMCKELDVQAPITVGISPNTPLEMVDPFCDLLSIHPYFFHGGPKTTQEEYEKTLDRDIAFALKAGKPLLATECCWGSLDDKVRVESVRYTLTQLRDRNIGWLAYLLHHSLIADAHRPEFGPVGGPGNLAFIEADGSLRPGHEVFNEF